MSRVLLTESHLADIADAIREKRGAQTAYRPGDMAAAIAGIVTPNIYTASDEGKVVANGTLVSQTARAAAITANGIYDTTTNNSVVVSLSGGAGNILHGEGKPTAQQGANGDIYLQTLPQGVLSDGATYLDTGVNGGSDVEFEVVFRTYNKVCGSNTSWSRSENSWGCILGCRYGSTSSELQLTTYSTKDSNESDCGTFGYNSTRKNVRMTTGKYEHISFKNGVVTDTDGNTTSVSGSWSGQYTIYAFALNNRNSAAQFGIVEIFKLKIWKAGALVKDYSAMVSNGVAGFWDAVSNQFVPPTSGTLTYTEEGEINDTFLKVDGAWVPLAGQNIDDVNM